MAPSPLLGLGPVGVRAVGGNLAEDLKGHSRFANGKRRNITRVIAPNLEGEVAKQCQTVPNSGARRKHC